jgi:hypothetical protein
MLQTLVAAAPRNGCFIRHETAHGRLATAADVKKRKKRKKKKKKT